MPPPTASPASSTAAGRRRSTTPPLYGSGSPHFDAAAVRFAGVVYGRRPPTVADAAGLREQLAATVDEAARR